MATLQVLRKRYKSIQATADMASALKTASSVKYAKISKVFGNIDAYSQVCDETLAMFGNSVLSRKSETVRNRSCIVLFSNDRGFCGGFNSELLRFFENYYSEEAEQPLLFVSGKKGIAFCQKNGLEYEEISLNEIPSYEDAEKLTAKLFELFISGEAERITLIFQYFKNMMTQTPAAETILPLSQGADEEDQELLFLPDRETALRTPAMYCLINSVYRIMLGHSAGIQAATTIAMRSACDNAEKSLEKLATLINRIRQSEVTNSVIETSSYISGGEW